MRHRPDFQPGKDWSYSNTGYVLLGMIIQRSTGHPWHEEVRDRIVRPLGLTNAPGVSCQVVTSDEPVSRSRSVRPAIGSSTSIRYGRSRRPAARVQAATVPAPCPPLSTR